MPSAGGCSACFSVLVGASLIILRIAGRHRLAAAQGSQRCRNPALPCYSPYMRPQNPSSRGFTLIEILLALALMALIATAITYTVGAMHRQSDSNVLQAEMKRLNDAVTAFTASGGTITGSDTALTVLAKI